jgi:hypothetical protein
MQTEKDLRVSFDTDAFHPMRTIPVRHELSNHPLLQLPALIELADRIPQRFIRFHSGNVRPDTSFEHAPKTNSIDMAPQDVIRNIEEAGAWLSLHHIQQDPVYARLVADVLDATLPKIASKDTGFHNFAGWVFVSAPGAITPYHMDHENNFILQLRGEKEIHVFDPLARSVVSERCLEVFHRAWSRELVTYREEHEAHATVYRVNPGDGAYMPTTAPHWVMNGDNVSITVSFTYYSREARRRERLYQLNWLMRRLGLSPAPIGPSPLRDGLKSALAVPVLGLERSIRRRRLVRARFAPVPVSRKVSSSA